jgi:hypothetical protein
VGDHHPYHLAEAGLLQRLEGAVDHCHLGVAGRYHLDEGDHCHLGVAGHCHPDAGDRCHRDVEGRCRLLDVGDRLDAGDRLDVMNCLDLGERSWKAESAGDQGR